MKRIAILTFCVFAEACGSGSSTVNKTEPPTNRLAVVVQPNQSNTANDSVQREFRRAGNGWIIKDLSDNTRRNIVSQIVRRVNLKVRKRIVPKARKMPGCSSHAGGVYR